MEVLGILVFFACILSSFLVLSLEMRYYLKLAVIMMLFVTLYSFVRMSFGRYLTTIDESYYVSLLGHPKWYITSIVSGYLTPATLNIVHNIFNDPVKTVFWYSLFIGLIYIFVLFASFRKFGLSKEHALISILLLFITNMYLWSVIQIRPQQLGFIIGLVLTVFLVRLNNFNKFNILMFLLGGVLLIFSHVLSFILYSLLFVVYLVSMALISEKPDPYLKKYSLVFFSIILSWTIFIFFPYSFYLIKNMTWITNNVLNLHLTATQFKLVSLTLLFTILSLAYLVVRKVAYLSFKNNIGRFFDIIREAIPIKFFWMVCILGVILAGGIQFFLERGNYSTNVYSSVLIMFLFQLGNLAFALFYLWGLLSRFYTRITSDIDILSIIWIFISAMFLIVSFFMPEGRVWGFKNWFLRGIQYFVIFATPLAGYSLLSSLNLNSHWKKTLPAFFVSLLIFISALNVARVPSFYNYDVVWPYDAVTLCEKYPFGFYYSRTEGSFYYREFAIKNLLTACGGKLLSQEELANFDLLIASSDNFGVYSVGYVPTRIKSFYEKATAKHIIVIGGGNKKIINYLASVLGASKIITLTQSSKCPLSHFSSGTPVILIGGKSSNPCVRLFENSASLPVHVEASFVSTPNSVYKSIIAEPWWNSTQGLFVIQSVEYRGIPILLIEGTNRDATIAAAYYYATNVPSISRRYYVVGEWKEADGSVLNVAQGSPKDSNGFSPGDSITIIEMG